MEKLLDFLQGFNMQTIVSMGVMLWYFTRDIKHSLNELHKDFQDMNTRVSRIEGTIYGKEIYDKKL